jgi:hypothetical protein
MRQRPAAIAEHDVSAFTVTPGRAAQSMDDIPRSLIDDQRDLPKPVMTHTGRRRT